MSSSASVSHAGNRALGLAIIAASEKHWPASERAPKQTVFQRLCCCAKKVNDVCALTQSDYVRALCEREEFHQNPTKCLLREMIAQGTWTSSSSDARAFVIQRIPDFVEKAGSKKYLRKFAEQDYFKDHAELEKVMIAFERCLNGDTFKADLTRAVDAYGKEARGDVNQNSEELFRTALYIFPLVEQLKSLKDPDEEASLPESNAGFGFIPS